MASPSMKRLASSSSPRWTYDVFLSFRGADTRHTITNYLYEALRRQGIVVFRDDDELERGKPISELFKAIEQSRCSIIVLSENYAQSKWCLKELAKIVEFMKTMDQRVLVVFYQVNRSDAINHNQTGRFEKLFCEHEEKLKKQFSEQEEKLKKEFREQEEELKELFREHEEKLKENLQEVQSWRDAMKEVGGLFGWDVTPQNETENVLEIVKHVFNELRPDLQSYDENLVGINLRLSQINKLLCMGLDDVRFIGIWGMGGIGKTTLARVIYKSIAHKFHGSCFLEDVRQASKHVGGLILLQEKLLSGTLMRGNVQIQGGDGAEMISKSLRERRVLIVLDDVDHVSQLQELAGRKDWFRFGSRVIITTRDEGLLDSFGVDSRYNVKSLNDDEALQLFAHEAFGVNFIEKGFLDFAMQFMDYAGGLPSAIKALGFSLHGRSIPAWKDAVYSLKLYLNKEIYEHLKISYDPLEPRERGMFQDIACFLKGRRKDQVIDIFQSFGIEATDGLDILRKKSLITVFNNTIQMHNLHQKMGREIFRRETSGKYRRLFLREDVNHALRHIQGLESIEAIFLDSDEHGESHLKAESFSAMTKLRVLSLHNVYLSGDIKYFSDELRLLSWPRYPLKCLPNHFQPGELLELNLPHSCIENLWSETKMLNKLKIINLSGSEFLSKTPDFIGVPNLERLVLSGCTRLRELHQSAGSLKHLILLDLKDCKRLRSIPFNLSMESLEILILSGCSRLKSFPEIVEPMEFLTELHLDGTAIQELHQSIGKLTGLVLLDLRDSKNLHTLPNTIGCLTSLKTLILAGCSKLEQVPESLGDVSCLKKLDVSNTSITHAPLSLRLLPNLETFHCQGLSRKFCHSLFPFSNMPRNKNSHSLGLKVITSLSNFRTVKVMSLSDCELEDGDIPNNLGCLSSLQFLDLSSNFFTNVPDSLCQLTDLRCLILDNCSRLQSLPKLPLGLRYVLARDCVSLKEYYNQENHRPSGETGVTILSYLTSDEHQNSKLAQLMLSNLYSTWEKCQR